MNRTTLYAGANIAFLATVGAGLMFGQTSGVHPLYLILLFALCSTPLLHIQRLNDRYALLLLFSMVYFHYFGTLDLITLFQGTPDAHTQGVISKPELVILLGGFISQLAYRLMLQKDDAKPKPPTDWPEFTLLIFGCALWCVATWFTWKFKVYVLTDKNAAAIANGLASLGGWQTMGLLLANMLQPLAILILAYVQCRYRRPYMLPLVIGVVLVQLAIGFIIDVKGEALIGAVLVIVTRLLVDGKLSKEWIISMVVFIIVAFPAMQANRTLRNQYRLDNTAVAQRAWEIAKEAFARREEASNGAVRAQTIFERQSLKGSVEMIVNRTGMDVPYQAGHTLTPIWAAFIPKVFWPDKPDVQTGQLVNKTFSVTNSAYWYTYISPSHLGELYWNFGWAGVILGMALIGALLGFVGQRVDMTTGVSITKVMIAAVTIRQLIIGFESSIAAPYVVWMRSLAAIWLLHWLCARRSPQPILTALPVRSDGQPVTLPNLMR